MAATGPTLQGEAPGTTTVTAGVHPIRIPRRRKASKCRVPSYHARPSDPSSRISPRPSPNRSPFSRSPAYTGSRSPAPVPQKEPEPEIEPELTPPPIETTLAARRAKRLAILAKYESAETTPSSGISSAVQPAPPVSSVSDPISQTNSSDGLPAIDLNEDAPSKLSVSECVNELILCIDKRESASPSAEEFALVKEGDEEDAQVKAQAQNDTGEQISAADYDPNQDRREDEGKRIREVKPEDDDVEMIEEEGEDEDDVDDMFAMATTVRKVKKVKKVTVSFRAASNFRPLTTISFQQPSAPALITTTLDSAADSEGYYSIILGEQLDGGRYQVFSALGKGMFANVVRARVLNGEVGEAGREVAIKIVRHQETMYVTLAVPCVCC